MIVGTWGVSLTEMSSCIVMPNMKTFIKKVDIVLFVDMWDLVWERVCMLPLSFFLYFVTLKQKIRKKIG